MITEGQAWRRERPRRRASPTLGVGRGRPSPSWRTPHRGGSPGGVPGAGIAWGVGLVTEWVVEEDAWRVLLSPPPGAFGERSINPALS